MRAVRWGVVAALLMGLLACSGGDSPGGGAGSAAPAAAFADGTPVALWVRDGRIHARAIGALSGGMLAAGVQAVEWSTPMVAADGSSRGLRAASIFGENPNDETDWWEDITVHAFDGAQWSAPSLVNFRPQSRAGGQRVAMNASGNGIVVFVEDSPANLGDATTYARWWNGQSWGASEVIDPSAPTTFGYFFPTLGMDKAGNVFAAWAGMGADPGAGIRVARRLAASGQWSTPVDLPIPSDSHAADPVIAVNDQGAATMVLMVYKMGPSGTEYIDRLYACRFDGSVWTVPERVVPADANAEGGTVAMNNAGDAVVAWYHTQRSPDGTTQDISINARRFVAAEQAWRAPELVATATISTSAPMSDPQIRVSLSPTGVASVIWNDDGDVRASANRGSGWSVAETLATGTSTQAIATVSGGAVVANWVERDSDNVDWSVVWKMAVQ